MAPDAFSIARRRMVTDIAASVHPAFTVLRAMGTVPCEAFVPSFFSVKGPGAPITASEGVAETIYDVRRPLGIAHDRDGHTTSTVSAPDVVARMLDLLELAPGMRVLEIGTGSGYNAALIAEIVGDPALVTTVDIDDVLVYAARARLRALGYGTIVAEAGDGHAGVAGRAPFDRIVATVGCADLSPEWAGQLASDGRIIAPLQHGGVHPIVDARPSAGAFHGQVVSRAGSVAIQGYQAGGGSPWPYAQGDPPDLSRPTAARPVAGTRPAAGARPAAAPARPAITGAHDIWDFSYYLALVDHRTSYLGVLDDGADSRTRLGADVEWAGPDGARLADELEAHAAAWVALGRPRLTDFVSTWLPRGEGAAPAEHSWVVARVDYDQIVSLPDSVRA